MRPRSRFVFAALLALTWSSLALAETPSVEPTLEPGALEEMGEMQLDDAFEKSTERNSDDFLRKLASPTSMDCTNVVNRSDLETCVVTTVGDYATTAPAALAQQ